MTEHLSALPIPRTRRLYGRDADLQRLNAYLTQAIDGHATLVLLGGEAGIGKTTTVDALSRTAAAHGALVLAGGCFDLAATPPYGPWLQLFHAYAPSPGLPEVPASLANLELADTLSGRDALFSEAVGFLSALVAHRSLVLVLEDLHWADEASLELLRTLARSLDGKRVLVIATYRDAELRPHDPLYTLLPHLVREGRAERVWLRRLTKDAIEELVADAYRLPPAQQAALTDWLDRSSEGNPFFLRELLHTLEHEAIIRPDRDGWSLGRLSSIQLPPLVRQVIERRLTWLAPDTRRLLEIAAVIGVEIPLGLWSEVVSAGDDELAIAIEQAIDARLIDELPNRDAYRFCHALIREVLYHGVVIPRRRGWHRRVAELGAAVPDVDPDFVAYHFQQAGDSRAATWLIRAGDRANRAFAYVAACQRFEQALALLARDGGAIRERIELLCELAHAYAFPDTERAIGYLDQASQLLEDFDDDALKVAVLYGQARMRALLGEPSIDDFRSTTTAYAALPADVRDRTRQRPLLWPSYGMLAQFFARYGEYEEAIRLAEYQLGDAGGSRPADRSADGQAYCALGLAWAGMGAPERAREAFRLGRETSRSIRDHHVHGMLLNWEMMEVILAYDTDDPDARRRLFDEAFNAWNQVELSVARPHMQVYAVLLLDGDWTEVRESAMVDVGIGSLRFDGLRALCDLEFKQGNLARARECLRFALPDGPATQPSNYYFYSTLWLFRIGAALAIDERDAETARRWIDAHDQWLDWSKRILDRPAGMLLRATCHVLSGERADAYAVAEAALAQSLAPRQPLALLATHRFLGQLDLAEGRHESAARHLDVALRMTEQCAAQYERALTLLALAELALATSDVATARDHLAEVRRICIPLEARPLIQRADALDERLDDLPRRVSNLPLSVREIEVLRLVARGLSNSEVGDLLFISPRTVAQHLQSIYNKLGISSRTAAAAFAFEHNLTDREPLSS